MAGAFVERPPAEGSRSKFLRGDARQEPANLNVSQDVDRVSRVETDSESGDGGIEMIFVYLQAFTARRRERNSWHEVCNVQKETDSEVSRSRRLHGARRLATRGNGAPAALAKPQPQPSND